MSKQEVDINFKVTIDIDNLNKSSASIGANMIFSKVQTNLTVAQLAYLIKLFYDLGMFTNRNQTEMLKVAAASFVTSQAHEISLKSLKAKYYNIDDTTKDAVKSRLIEMINHINKKS